jgi:hypothetical protein
MRVGDSIWGVVVSGDNGRNSLRWIQIAEATGEVEQSGVIPSDGVHDFIYPSIAVNPDGDVVITATRTGPNSTAVPSDYGSSWVFVGATSGGVTTFDSGTEVQAGGASLGGATSRLGDYSSTSRDPTDPEIFWSISGFGAGANVWGTNVTEVIVPATDEARWKSNTSGAFNSSTDWSSGSVPSSTDHVIFSRATAPGTGSYTVNMPASTATVMSQLSVRQGWVNFNLNGGTIGSGTTTLAIAEFGGTPTVVFAGGTVHSQTASLAAGSLFTSATSRAHVTLSSGTWINVGTVYVGGTARINVAAGGNSFLRFGHVVVHTNSLVDLNDNDMQLNGGTSTYASVSSVIASARDGGAWTGTTGITSTSAKNQA